MPVNLLGWYFPLPVCIVSSFLPGKRDRFVGSLSENAFFPKLFVVSENNACNIKHMAALVFPKCLGFRKNVNSQTAS